MCPLNSHHLILYDSLWTTHVESFCFLDADFHFPYAAMNEYSKAIHISDCIIGQTTLRMKYLKDITLDVAELNPPSKTN